MKAIVEASDRDMAAIFDATLTLLATMAETIGFTPERLLPLAKKVARLRALADDRPQEEVEAAEMAAEEIVGEGLTTTVRWLAFRHAGPCGIEVTVDVDTLFTLILGELPR